MSILQRDPEQQRILQLSEIKDVTVRYCAQLGGSTVKFRKKQDFPFGRFSMPEPRPQLQKRDQVVHQFLPRPRLKTSSSTFAGQPVIDNFRISNSLKNWNLVWEGRQFTQP